MEQPTPSKPFGQGTKVPWLGLRAFLRRPWRCSVGLAAFAALAGLALLPMQSPAPAQSSVCVRGDLDCDGKPDLLWRNYGPGADAGKNVVWFMDGITYRLSINLPDQSDLNWRPGGTGDFDSDAKTDILWRNYATGQNEVWLLDGDTDEDNTFPRVPLPSEIDTNWRIAGVADFNGDNQPDILWQNSATGGVRIWYMNGTALLSSATLGTESDINWQIAGTGDFDGDNRPDLFWRYQGAGTAAGTHRLWYVTGTSYVTSASFLPVPNLNWQIAGIGDFARTTAGRIVNEPDGKTDVLWRHSRTGENAVWLLDGTQFVATTYLPQAIDNVALSVSNGLSSTPQTQGATSPWSALSE